ncbi:hypothetical protein CEXT_106601 [Caerostris extrusa]|uniref:Uncharacterized protein n=1 Tax=Caerostris extrusa TaxID=172846 RepID=A0AAV4QJ21_CAEEX|nr:hypothetical protein CEXT_106601 [Caerostris extrusa]
MTAAQSSSLGIVRLLIRAILDLQVINFTIVLPYEADVHPSSTIFFETPWLWSIKFIRYIILMSDDKRKHASEISP